MTMPRIALHIIMPDQVSGPNTSNWAIARSALSDHYSFDFLVQEFPAGGRLNLALIRHLRNQVRQCSPDLIHVAGLQASGLHAVLAARLAGHRNILVTVHGFSGDALGIGPIKRWFFSRLIEPVTLSLSRCVLTVCEEAGQKRMIGRAGSKYLGVIHNAAPEVDFDLDAARRAFRAELGIGESDLLVGVSGRMVYDKGITFISEAMREIEDPSTKFVFFGDGEYLEWMAEQHSTLVAQRRLFLLGRRTDVLRLLPGCDLFLFATLHENLSNALLEAMAVGLPVIATAVGGNLEVVEDGGNGYLIPPADSAAIASRVLELRSASALRRDMGCRSRAIVTERFSSAVIYAALDAVYSAMLSSDAS